MPALKPQDTRDPRYIAMMETRQRQEAHAEAVRQAELAAKRGASDFLAYGPGGRQVQQPTVIPPAPTAIVVHREEVADLSAQKLEAEAFKAGEIIQRELASEGVRFERLKPKAARPFEDKKLVHLCDTRVGAIPYPNGKGMLMIHMSNFSSGKPVVTNRGLHYEGVTAERDTSKERFAFRTFGVENDQNGKPVRVDKNFTDKGLAFTEGNTANLIYACLKSAGKDADAWLEKLKARNEAKAKAEAKPAATSKTAGPTNISPLPPPRGMPSDRRRAAERQQSNGMKM